MKKPIVRMANDTRLLALGVLASWFVAATLYALIEGVAPLDAMYWGMTTMSTVGYGDMSPATAAGKVLTMTFQAWAIFVLVPCAVSNLIDSVRVDEAKFTHEEQEWTETALKSIAEKQGISLAPSPSDY